MNAPASVTDRSGSCDAQRGPQATPLRVGVALGAGSAAAMAEIGALQVLCEAGIPIHSVAGTSAGAIVGAAFASGRLGDLEKGLSELTRSRVLRLFDLTWPRSGFLQGVRALELIRPHLGERIEDFALPYAAVATDLHSGEEVHLRSGPVFDAVRASIAIPGIFTPWQLGERVLVDGGLVNPVPVSAARALGADFVIAINVLPRRPDLRSEASLRQHLLRLQPEPDTDATAMPNGTFEKLGLMEVVWRSSRILATEIATRRLREEPPSWLLQISVPEVGMFDVHRTGELTAAGRRCAEAALPRLLDALQRALPLRERLADWGRRAAEHPRGVAARLLTALDR